MSAIIFILVFQPVSDHLMMNKRFGVLINDERVITLPYADDFCLITTDMRVHKRLIRVVLMVTHGETASCFTKIFMVSEKNNAYFFTSRIESVSQKLRYLRVVLMVTHGEKASCFTKIRKVSRKNLCSLLYIKDRKH